MPTWARITTRLFLSIILTLAPCEALQDTRSVFHAQNATSGGGGGGVTWTVVQHPTKFNCSSTGGGTLGCTVTVTSVTAGNLLIILSATFSGAVSGGTPSFSSAGGNGSDNSSVFTHCPSTLAKINYSAGNWEATDCSYVLSAIGGDTSMTFTWVYPVSGGTNQAIDVDFFEIHRSTGSATLDTSNIATATCSSCSAPNLTLSGTSDFIAQWNANQNFARRSAVHIQTQLI